MKTRPLNSPSAPELSGGHAEALEVTAIGRLVFISGQVPEAVDGSVPKDFREQAHLAWANLLAQLATAGMSITNLVKVTTFLSSRDHGNSNREVREEILGSHAFALSVIFAEMFDRRWLLEIEAIAAE